VSQTTLSPPHAEHVDRTDEEPFFEVIDGQYVELPPMGIRENHIASRLSGFIFNYNLNFDRGRIETEPLFKLFADRNQKRRPDVAFISYERWPKRRPVPTEAAWEVVPDLAVEVVSPNDYATYLIDKIEDYFQAGSKRVWVIWPARCYVYDYQSPTEINVLRVGDDLDGGTVLPGFRLALADLFEVHQADDDDSSPETDPSDA